MIEKWRKSHDEGGAFGALLTDLSKAFDCLPHKLLIVKLHAYGVDILSLKLLHSCLTKRKQRVELNGTCSSWSEIIFGVPQGSILGPLLFKLFLCNLFQFSTNLDITNYADANTPHSTNKNLNKLLHDLEKMSDTLFKWFTDNLMKANPEKSHLTNSAQEIQINVGGMAIYNSKCEHSYKKQIVWKHGPNWPFYTLKLRTKLY